MTDKIKDIVFAYRVYRPDGGALIVYRCPHCRRTHTHGDPDGKTCRTSRAADCANPKSRWFGREAQIIVVSDLPESPRWRASIIAEINSANEVLAAGHGAVDRLDAKPKATR